MSTPEPIDPNFRIELPTFEGPLDLLLHLISKHELDILDLPIAFVTERYLEYLGVMKTLNLDVAAEYLLMAAKLAHIKSKMLLPTPPEDQEDEQGEEADPREELIRRLLEYQKYRLVAQDLGARGIAGRDVFTRGIPGPRSEDLPPLAELGLFKLLDAFSAMLARTKNELAFEITAERISIQERMTEIVDQLRGRRSCSFDELFEEVRTTYDVVVTFLAILEMAKMRIMRIFQVDPDAPIHLEYRVLDVDDPGPASEEAEGAGPQERVDALDLRGDEGHTSASAGAVADPPITPERDEAES